VAQAAKGQSAHVLLVEDDPAIRELMQMVLGDMGLSIDVASTGPMALELASQRQPNMVILDLGLPEMYGKTVGSVLRRRYGSNLPVMVVSALSAPAVAQDAWEIGAFAYITKPFELDAFSETVQRGLRMSSASRA